MNTNYVALAAAVKRAMQDAIYAVDMSEKGDDRERAAVYATIAKVVFELELELKDDPRFDKGRFEQAVYS